MQVPDLIWTDQMWRHNLFCQLRRIIMDKQWRVRWCFVWAFYFSVLFQKVYCNRTDFSNFSQIKTKRQDLFLDLSTFIFFFIFIQLVDLTVVRRVKVSSLEVLTKSLLGRQLGPITKARSVNGASTSKRRKLLISVFDWRNLQ